MTWWHFKGALLPIGHTLTSAGGQASLWVNTLLPTPLIFMHSNFVAYVWVIHSYFSRNIFFSNSEKYHNNFSCHIFSGAKIYFYIYKWKQRISSRHYELPLLSWHINDKTPMYRLAILSGGTNRNVD